MSSWYDCRCSCGECGESGKVVQACTRHARLWGFGRNDGDAKFGGGGGDGDGNDDDDDDANAAKQEEREDALRYRSELAELLSWIWVDSGAHPTGFALKEDLKVLRAIKPTILTEQPRKGRSTGGGGGKNLGEGSEWRRHWTFSSWLS